MKKIFKATKPTKITWEEFEKNYKPEEFVGELFYAGDRLTVSWDKKGTVRVSNASGAEMKEKNNLFLSDKNLSGWVIEGVYRENKRFVITDVLAHNGQIVTDAEFSFRRDLFQSFASLLVNDVSMSFAEMFDFPGMFSATEESFESVCGKGYEAMMARKVNAPYLEGKKSLFIFKIIKDAQQKK